MIKHIIQWSHYITSICIKWPAFYIYLPKSTIHSSQINTIFTRYNIPKIWRIKTLNLIIEKKNRKSCNSRILFYRITAKMKYNLSKKECFHTWTNYAFQLIELERDINNFQMILKGKIASRLPESDKFIV